MRFRIKRASDGRDAQPCEGSIPVERTETQAMPWGQHGDAQQRQQSWAKFCDERFWNHPGRNHRRTAGGIYLREITRTDWMLDLESLDELLALQQRVGQPLIVDRVRIAAPATFLLDEQSVVPTDEQCWEILIYDTCIE